ncbi:MAG: hypothetical protein AAFV29_14155, partial [Myxococcota bacterium]
MKASELLDPLDSFSPRHVGVDANEVQKMLDAIGLPSLDQLVDDAVPAAIRMSGHLEIEKGCGEQAALDELAAIGAQNQVFTSLIGM